MADVVAEPHTAGAENEAGENEAANADSDKPAEMGNGAPDKKSNEVSNSQSANGSKKASEEDGHERGNKDKGEQRSSSGRDERGGRGRGRYRGRIFRGSRGGGRGRGNFQPSVRTRYERKEESSDAMEIRRQVDFYFSDSNLPVDKFLLEEVGGSENKPFPLKTIHNFKRMRHFQPFSAIVEAVKTSDFLVVNDQDEVYRKVPLDRKFSLDTKKNSELLTSDSMLRSIYAKGFGEEQDSTGFDIEEFFQPYGVLSVRLRRHADGSFKGSVFVELENEASARQFLDMDEKPMFKDKELEVMSKRDYVEMKANAILEGTVIPKSPRPYTSYGNKHRDRRGGFSGANKRKIESLADNGTDNDNWNERRERFQQTRGDSRSRSRSPYRKPAAAAEKTDAAEPVDQTHAEPEKLDQPPAIPPAETDATEETAAK